MEFFSHEYTLGIATVRVGAVASATVLMGTQQYEKKTHTHTLRVDEPYERVS